VRDARLSGLILITPKSLATATRGGNTLTDIASAEQSLQLLRVEAVAGDYAAIEEQHGDIEAVAALEDGVAVDIDNVDGRQGCGAAEGVELAQHLVAEVAVLAMDDREAWGVGTHCRERFSAGGLRAGGHRHRRMSRLGLSSQ